MKRLIIVVWFKRFEPALMYHHHHICLDQ